MACLRLLFLVTFGNLTLTLTFSGMNFVLTQYPSRTFPDSVSSNSHKSTLCEFELFPARLTDVTAQNVKTVFGL